MMTENMTLHDGHKDDIVQNCALETYITFLTRFTMNLILKGKNKLK